MAVIRESHVLPAFVTRWLKETSATGFFRSPETPNRRLQDLSTERLLCDSCEQRFSVAEGRFARQVFIPFHSGRSRFQYDSWLPYFAVSLAWRCLVTAAPEELKDLPQHVQPVERARVSWAAFLLGHSREIAPYRHNLLFTPAGINSRAHLPEGVAWYMLRSADMTPVFGDSEVAMFTKLPGMILWSSVTPPDPGGWRGTRIASHGTLKLRNQAIDDAVIGTWLIERAEIAAQQGRRLSRVQQARIQESIRRDPGRFKESASFQTFLEERRIIATNRGKRSGAV